MKPQPDQSSADTLISIAATVRGRDTLVLRSDCGTATGENGQRYELSTTMSGNPIVRLPDGRWVIFAWQALVAAAVEAGRGCRLDTDGDGNCAAHPEGCPK